jgi:hypothetical protein
VRKNFILRNYMEFLCKKAAYCRLKSRETYTSHYARLTAGFPTRSLAPAFEMVIGGCWMDKQKVLLKMDLRMAWLEEMAARDYDGGLHNWIAMYREIKYWKEAIERGEFDGK